ncbi:hypothetical protein BKA60DRAFT_609404 [Fusarium oxysporum]|nr:hypothetical protein BKA60DRAFT_609404 [Fusarium oxysporum]
MAEVLGVVASAIAVIQISKEIISLCKFYIEALSSDAPTSLRAVLIEVSTLRSVLEGLEFISKCETFTPALQNRLAASDGPIEGFQATFAKLAWPLKQGQVQDLLQQISRHKDGIQLALTTEVTKDIKDIKAVSEEIRSILTGEQRHRVYDRLTSTDPSPIHNQSRKSYEHGTGSWMLRSPYWTDWLASSVRCLWVHGIPGSGKAILARGCQQRLSRRAEVVSTLRHDLFRRGGEPSIPELLDALEQILQVFSCVYIVIDAVDESNPRDELLEVIHTLVTDPKLPNIKILVSSREYIDIERVMEKISVSVPMSNKLVEQDIRLHVRSTLRSNIKFQCWPNDLLIDVENAVSTQAKGMFRWAFCQLHELQRLKGERHVVSKALERLPKDLDETYDRVLLRIPQEDWQFPPGNGTPSVLLLDAIKSSTSRTDNHRNLVLYNSERLRELCGCLISSLADSISFAHYTVKEYLDSARIRQGPLFVFSTKGTKVLSTCLDVLLLQAQTFASQDLKNLEVDDSLLFDKQDLWKDLRFHSFFHAMPSLSIWGHEISKSDDFYGRVKRLLCPSTQYFRCLGKLGFNDRQEEWLDLLFEVGSFGGIDFETIDWNERLTQSDACLFLSLFLLTKDMDSPLLSRLIREADPKGLFSSRIVLKKEGCIHTRNGNRQLNDIVAIYEFDGPLIEVMVQFLYLRWGAFRDLLVNHRAFYNPSTTLIYLIGHHTSDLESQSTYDRPFFCPLRHLLEAGAQPNLPGYPLTPLQRAVAARNLNGVQLLLRFGADPNYIGDPLSSAWPASSLMAGFERFHGMSPLRICRSGYCVSLVNDLGGDSIELTTKTIQQLLLAYGGRDFQWEPSEPLMV